jgi:demethoxyubiquinone hydroxylase (CLK1/Coq7/Cat5 family)
MSDETPKSALELAMERLRRQDAEEGVSERSVSDEDKAKIAEIRKVHAAKLAQQEILHKSKLMTTWEPEERAKAEEQNRREVQHLNDELERKLAKIRERPR